jgi:hypothetical protein
VLDWNRTKGAKNPEHYIKLKCANCGKIFYKERGQYKHKLAEYPDQTNFYCSSKCDYKKRIGHPVTPESVAKIRAKQLGISVLARGRVGHPVSEETKEKIRQKKLGVSCRSDHDIILKELAYRGTPKYAITKDIIPDAIFIEDGKLVALEVEKKPWELSIRKKMKSYENSTDYDKVVVVWYSPKGERLKEWHKDNGEWKLISS